MPKQGVFMLEPTKKVMNEYRILVVKMTLDFVNNGFANFEFLCDIGVLYGLIVLLPLLKEVNNLMKLLQTLLGKFVFTFCGP
jgi:hypothetical protein